MVLPLSSGGGGPTRFTCISREKYVQRGIRSKETLVFLKSTAMNTLRNQSLVPMNRRHGKKNCNPALPQLRMTTQNMVTYHLKWVQSSPIFLRGSLVSRRIPNVSYCCCGCCCGTSSRNIVVHPITSNIELTSSRRPDLSASCA